MQSLIGRVFESSDQIENNRTIENVLTALTSEVGELAQEISIESGHGYKTASEDGVVGEAVDVILCALDIIHIFDPMLSEADIITIANAKLKKWIEKETEFRNRPYWIDLPSNRENDK